jgi:hypothetical protein
MTRRSLMPPQELPWTVMAGFTWRIQAMMQSGKSLLFIECTGL